MHTNTGYAKESLELIRHFVKVFDTAEIICSPSSSCVAMIRDHYPRLAADSRDTELINAIQRLIPKVFEFTEFLVDKLAITDVGAFFPHAVTFHPSCHSMRSLHLGDKPTSLLRSVRGLTLIDLPENQQCCGFGGTFSIKNPDVSAAMLADKVKGVLETRAEFCAAVDNSCLMHIGGALSRQRTGVATVHIAEILASTEAKSL